jgi:glycosyltransferase involved in cell wall biosynthesis
MSVIDLIYLSDGVQAPAWELGRVLLVRRETVPVTAAVERLTKSSSAEAVLFWDTSFGVPDQELVRELIGSPCDCWHAGLCLGTAGLPGIIDFLSPAWMLACDPSVNIEATSWRLSVSACLVRMEVLRKLGGPRPEFKTLEAGALEMGHRWIRRGALMRHVPRLFQSQPTPFGFQPSALPFVDELRFAYYRYGRKWAAWAVFRAVLTHYTHLATALRSWRIVMSSPRPAEPQPFHSINSQKSGHKAHPPGSFTSQLSTTCPQSSVSVLIPTVDRYPYLRTLLGQLRQQTVRPLEIIIVDQTAVERREAKLLEDFHDLPVRLVSQDQPGQCTSRNAGLQIARGDYILFIDDDDEVPPNLIQLHLETLQQFQADVSSGVADEVGAGSLPADFQLLRASDVFPTNNTMIRRDVLLQSGLFDLAYNHRARADGDLGMRIHLAGALMILNPAISVLHHHAPSGGLRKHKARTVTYAMSRTSLFCRALASASEIYMARRYYPHRHACEMLWQSGLGSFSVRGSFPKKIAKFAVSGLVLPATIWKLRSRVAEAHEITRFFPRIEELLEAPLPAVGQKKETTPANCGSAPALLP